MSDAGAYQGNLQRGQLLREKKIFAQACRYLGEAIQADPEQPQAYLELALAQSQIPAQSCQALGTMDRAVALAPNSAHFLGYKAYLLGHFGQHREALQTGNHALEINPCCHIALLAQANAHTKLGHWDQAGFVTQRMLQLDPEDDGALNLRAQALRFQGRDGESRAVIEHVLSNVPNDSFAQANAGWAALKGNDFIRANGHFLSALSADPDCEYARRGLLQSLRSRNWIYRVGLKMMGAFAGSSDKTGRVCAFAVLLSGGLLLGPILLFAAMALTLQPLSNFFLLFDPKSRCALKIRERRLACCTGAITGALLLFTGLEGLIGLLCAFGGYLLLFAISVYLPQLADKWRGHQGEIFARELRLREGSPRIMRNAKALPQRIL